MTKIQTSSLIDANFIARINRFVALVDIDGRQYRAHVPSSGRMKELLQLGAEVLVTTSKPGGRTDYKLLMVKHNEIWVSIDSLLPNHLIRRSLLEDVLPELQGYSIVKSEQNFGHSRFDFLLQQGNKPDCYVEVKSVTLVEDGIAMFPDAPSIRGAKHMNQLAEAVSKGFRGVVLFVVQRTDAGVFTANTAGDKEFSDALKRAAEQGVEVYARICRIIPPEVMLGERIPTKI